MQLWTEAWIVALLIGTNVGAIIQVRRTRRGRRGALPRWQAPRAPCRGPLTRTPTRQVGEIYATAVLDQWPDSAPSWLTDRSGTAFM